MKRARFTDEHLRLLADRPCTGLPDFDHTQRLALALLNVRAGTRKANKEQVRAAEVELADQLRTEVRYKATSPWLASIVERYQSAVGERR